jgi:hypothetical protein
MMKEGGVGGANTKTGLAFEVKTDLEAFLNSQLGYTTIKNSKYSDILFMGDHVGSIFKQYGLYDYLSEQGVDWKEVVSSRLLPDDAIYVITNNTAYIIEKKTQSGGGSVDEKLQTCDFKKKQYMKLFSRINVEVKYMYLLDRWFDKPRYRDVFDYIHSVGCEFYFDYLPLNRLGLPVPTTK